MMPVPSPDQTMVGLLVTAIGTLCSVIVFQSRSNAQEAKERAQQAETRETRQQERVEAQMAAVTALLTQAVTTLGVMNEGQKKTNDYITELTILSRREKPP